ncbi:MAG: SDR family NAD(P)-dependent oxidoreductase, partial [Pseudomonadota bacterium]
HIAQLGIDTYIFDGSQAAADIAAKIDAASHILSTIPPRRGWREGDAETADPVLAHYSLEQLTSGTHWLAYLSTTGVYGDHAGAWVDEATPAAGGTNAARQRADADWRGHHASHIFRLPGIYGPGRSAIERAQSGKMSRIDKPGQVFSRIHVDDIVQTLIASAHAPSPGEIYNVADDEPASGWAVEDYACQLLGITPPPLVALEDASLSPRGKEFYSQCRRVRNDKIKQDLGVRLIYPDYRAGLRGCLAASDL